MKQTAPSFCCCMANQNAPSTHRGAAHFTRCTHSTLRATTRKFQRPTYRRLPGTRGVTVVLDGGR